MTMKDVFLSAVGLATVIFVIIAFVSYMLVMHPAITMLAAALIMIFCQEAENRRHKLSDNDWWHR